MKKWFLNLQSKNRKILIISLFVISAVCFIVIGCIPKNGDELNLFDYILVLLFITSLVFAILFAVWNFKIKKVNLDKEEKDIQNPNTTLQKINIQDNIIEEFKNFDFTFIDVETPNHNNDRVCSIGIISYRNGELTFKKNILINPEVRFDNLNINIHGISPQMVKDAPTIQTVWNDISKFFINTILVGHNISSDLNILDKALNSYGFKLNSFSYIDTMHLAKKYIQSKSYKLEDLCKDLNCCTRTHDALSDCIDCKNLLLHILKNNKVNIFEETEDYYLHHSTYSTNEFKVKSSKETTAYKKIQSLIAKITEDNQLSTDEINEFITLVEENDLTEVYPINKTYQLLKNKTNSNEVIEKMAEINGEIKFDKFDKQFNNKIFCLTGDFVHGSKEEVSNYIISKGGQVKDVLTQKVDYCVRGMQGSELYAYGNYGSKVKKALEYKEKGLLIKIISEDDLF